MTMIVSHTAPHVAFVLFTHGLRHAVTYNDRFVKLLPAVHHIHILVNYHVSLGTWMGNSGHIHSRSFCIT